jgi:hypothetical protein
MKVNPYAKTLDRPHLSPRRLFGEFPDFDCIVNSPLDGFLLFFSVDKSSVSPELRDFPELCEYSNYFNTSAFGTCDKSSSGIVVVHMSDLVGVSS